MQFPTPTFAIFMLAMLPLWHALGKLPAQRAVLGLMASALFFGSAGPWSLSCACAYGAALALASLAAPKISKAVFALMLALLCLPLAYFKYSAWIESSLGTPAGWAWSSPSPFGLSFYTFSGLAWILALRDGSWRGSGLQALGALMSPMVGASGPVLRPNDAAGQLALPLEIPTFPGCAAPFLLGFFLKLVLASRLAEVCDPIFNDPGSQNAISLAVAIHAYGAQLYADFAGYSLMAIGVGRALGVELPSNFEAPYASVSLAEFWRRWHISLSTFWRERIYFPLGGSRMGKARELANLMAVMLLCGLWHGAGANFIIWGALHGAMLCVGRLWPWAGMPSIPKPISWILTFEAAMWAWLPFRAQDSDALSSMISSLGRTASHPPLGLPLLGACFLALTAEHTWKAKAIGSAQGFGARHPLIFVALSVGFAIACIELAPEGIPPFIYAGF